MSQDHTEQHSDQPKPTRRKPNRASRKAEPKATEGSVETKTKDGRHRRQLPSGAVAIV